MNWDGFSPACQGDPDFCPHDGCEHCEIGTLGELIEAVADSFVGGNELTSVEFTRKRDDDGELRLVITVHDQEPGTNLSGEYWFNDEHKIDQVFEV